VITLGIETATGLCAAALVADGQVRAVRAEAMTRGQAERLVPLIQEVLAEAGTGFADIDRFGVTVGPGTFTGLRIGLAAARGLALAADRPLIGITSFEAMVHAQPESARTATLVACIESRRDDLYVQAFDPALRPLADPADVLPHGLAAYLDGLLGNRPLILVGDAAARAAAALGDRPGVAVRPATGGAEAVAVARLAADLPPADIATRPADPFYLRPPDVTLPRGGGHG